MASVASQVPANYLSGLSVDNNFQPLNDCGLPNPLFYQQYWDDFNVSNKSLASYYTSSTSGTGAATGGGTAAVGGVVTFSSGTTAGYAQLQLINATFLDNIAPKKLFYLTRIKASSWTTAGNTIIVGLTPTNGAPTATPTDGIYFSITGAGVLSINSAVGSATTTVAIPTAAYNLVNATYIDLAFYVTRLGDVLAFVDTQLVGYVPQSNLGTSGNPQNVGPVARILGFATSAVLLNPTLAIIQSSTTAVTVTADFQYASQER